MKRPPLIVRRPDEIITPLEPIDLIGYRRKHLDIPYDAKSPIQKLDLILPGEGEGPFPLVVYLHGGGFAVGDKRDSYMAPFLQALSYGFAFASVNFRLSDEATFPAAIHDCREAIRFLIHNASHYALDAQRIGVVGCSSGGNLAAMLAMNLPNGALGEQCVPAHKHTECVIQAAVSWFGPMDFLAMDEQAEACGGHTFHGEAFSAESCYMGGQITEMPSEQVQQANPSTYISPAMCPLLLGHGTQDKIVPYAQSEGLANAITEKLGPGRVTLEAVEGADHEDAVFRQSENMNRLWRFFEETLLRRK